MEDYKEEENNKKRPSFHLRLLPSSALLLKLSLVSSHLVGLEGVDVVDDSLLSLSPDFVQLV